MFVWFGFAAEAAGGGCGAVRGHCGAHCALPATNQEAQVLSRPLPFYIPCSIPIFFLIYFRPTQKKTEDCAAQVVITSLDPTWIATTIQSTDGSIISVRPASRESPTIKYGEYLASECGEAILCWLAAGASEAVTKPQLNGRPLSSVFAFEPGSLEASLNAWVEYTGDLRDEINLDGVMSAMKIISPKSISQYTEASYHSSWCKGRAAGGFVAVGYRLRGAKPRDSGDK